MASSRVCSIPDCDKRHKAHGWCVNHYHNWQRNGDPVTSRGAPMRFLLDIAARHTDDGDCLIWPFGRNSKGYAHVFHDGSMRTAFRVLCEVIHGPAPSADHEAAHRCGNGFGGCVNPTHVRWATHKQNAQDRIDQGKQTRGEDQHNSKLTECQVREIRALKGKASQYEIAERFGIRQPQVGRIHRREAWAWLV